MNNKRNNWFGKTSKEGGFVFVIATTTNGEPVTHTLLFFKEKLMAGDILSIFTTPETKSVFELSQLRTIFNKSVSDICQLDYDDLNWEVYTDFSNLDKGYFSIKEDFSAAYDQAKIRPLSYSFVKDAIDPRFSLDYEYVPIVISNDITKEQFIPIDSSVYTSEEDVANIEYNRNKVSYGVLPEYAVPVLESFKRGTHNVALFTGDSSTGKSFAARMIGVSLEIPVHSYNFSAGSDESLIQGKFIPRKDSSGFMLALSQFINCYRHGGLFIAEELNFALPSVTGPFNSSLDFLKEITLVDEMNIKMHPNFRMITCINPCYEGTNPLNLALLSRQELVVRFPNLTSNQMLSRLKDKFGIQNDDFLLKLSTLTLKINNMLKQQGINAFASLRELESCIKLLQNGTTMDTAIKQTIIDKVMLYEDDETYEAFNDVLKGEINELSSLYFNSMDDTPDLIDIKVSNIDTEELDSIFDNAEKAHESVDKEGE